ncbi:MAG TPA: PLP-dependent aminotransferase family protein [Thermoleophilaceae bacterium]|nr:PLP-dependent aminotransferase family protein [Thermoleophilaceae bacterium]
MSINEASWLRLERTRGETLRSALERTLRDGIAEGALRAGTRLPSSRALAAQLGVSRGVASDAYAQLEAQGYLVVLPRRAPTVASVPAPAPRAAGPAAPPARAVRHNFDPTTPDVGLFPRREWAAALTHVLREMPASDLGYGDPRGHPALREALASHLGRTRGVVADPERIVVVQGTAQAIDLLLRLLAARGARSIAVEDPSLTSQHERVTGHGLQLLGVPVDDQGVVIDALQGDAVIVTPAHQFPTGVVLSGTRRRALLDWARSHDAWVIEDDYDGEFRYDREPVRALQGLDPRRVAHLGTLSKSLAPALRLGWVVLPEALGDASDAKRMLDAGSPGLEQLAFLRLLETGGYDRHVRRVRGEYRRRRDRMAAALARELPGHPVAGVAAGVHLRLDLPPRVADTEVARGCNEAGLAVEALGDYALGQVAPGLVLGYGLLHESAIDDAVAALARELG